MSESTLASAAPRPTFSQRTDRLRWSTIAVQSIVGVSTSFIYLINIWIGPLNAAYGWDLSTIALTFSLITAVGLPANIIAGKFRDRYGSRAALRVGGIGYAASIALASLGFNVWFFVIGMGVFATFFMFFAYLAMMANIGELFPDRRGLALGVVIAVTNFGGALIAPLAELLVRVMGIAGSLAAQGAVYGGIMVICSFLIVEAPDHYAPRGWSEPLVDSVDKRSNVTAPIDQVKRDLPWHRMLVSLPFWMFFLTMTLVSVGLLGFNSNMSLIAANVYGVDSATGAWYFTVYGLGMGVGALIIGVLSDRIGPLATIAVGSGMVGIAFVGLLIEGLNSTSIFLVVIALGGVVFGGVQSVLPNVLMSAWGEKNFGVNFGLMAFSGATAAFIGGQLAVSVDASVLLAVGAGTAALGCVAALLTRLSINQKLGFKVIR